ncbi:hypothetical protein OOK60_13795 [Trichothermofontia sichuanensis B231]|uniref:hypothetical protein n=1 Tax=Trichothermofontia sichuanensis TaxID=3045816 RepID=UPI002246BEF6|nr:hypothetical protein OOK60_13795 [Trichothermofontia sichuanensis B231]
MPTTTELAQQRAEQAQQQVRQIVRNLRQTGMTADQIARVTGLSLEQVDTLRAINPKKPIGFNPCCSLV